MRKIYKLKQWYSVDDAANRLSLTLGEEVSTAEMLELALDGQISLFWYMRHVSVQEVEFQTRSIMMPLDIETMFGQELNDQNSSMIQYASFFPFEDRTHVSILDGPHRLMLEVCGALEDYFRAYLTNTGGDLISIDGFFVEDDKERTFQIMESFGGPYLKKMYPDERVNFSDVRGFYPSANWPEMSEIGFTKSEIEKFESELQDKEEKAVSSRERHTLYKMLIAMAKDGYGYDHVASKSPFPKELEGILDRLGLPVSDDTIRNKLKEASELLDQNLDDQT